MPEADAIPVISYQARSYNVFDEQTGCGVKTALRGSCTLSRAEISHFGSD